MTKAVLLYPSFICLQKPNEPNGLKVTTVYPDRK